MKPIFTQEHLTEQAATQFVEQDPLRNFRDEFCFPQLDNVDSTLYFAGHSLGLRPVQTQNYIQEELDSWAKFGVEGHFAAKHPWLPYHEFVTGGLARLVGAKEEEVVAMNTLTTNLHLMLVSFYRPTKKRFKILIENNTFPSDKYAVDSQARFHGFDPEEAIIQLEPGENGLTVSQDRIMEIIEREKDSLALVMLGNCNYLSGQYFDIEAITAKAHEVGAMAGFNLAHGAGNLALDLHKWDTDFAVWCSYKYLNSGPGGIAAAFVHEKHHNDPNIPRFEGWWGTNKQTRFLMEDKIDPIKTVEAWQLSNPPIFQLASLRASLDLFDKATMPKIIEKRDHLTGYLEFLLKEKCGDFLEIVTPAWQEGKQTRGAMLCIRFKKDPKKLSEELVKKGVVVDFREPDIIRIAPAPLYNNHLDVYNLVEMIRQFHQG
jgi:kynureninase